jgi:hypothetical protein
MVGWLGIPVSGEGEKDRRSDVGGLFPSAFLWNVMAEGIDLAEAGGAP